MKRGFYVLCALGSGACVASNAFVIDATAYARQAPAGAILRANLVTAGEVMADVTLKLDEKQVERVEDVVKTSANVYAILAFADLNGDGKCDSETEDYWDFLYQYPASNADLEWTVQRDVWRDTRGCSWFEGPPPKISDTDDLLPDPIEK